MLLRLDGGTYGCESLARIISQKFYFPPHIHQSLLQVIEDFECYVFQFTGHTISLKI